MTIYITITVPINVIILLMFGLITYMSHLYINQHLLHFIEIFLHRPLAQFMLFVIVF